VGIRDGQDPWLRGQYVYPETPKRPGGYPRPSAEDRTRALDLLVSWASRPAVDYLRGANQQLKRRSHGRLSSWLAAVKAELTTLWRQSTGSRRRRFVEIERRSGTMPPGANSRSSSYPLSVPEREVQAHVGSRS